MSDFLVKNQKLLDKLSDAAANLRQATRERIRAQEYETYWRKQIEVMTQELQQGKVGR